MELRDLEAVTGIPGQAPAVCPGPAVAAPAAERVLEPWPHHSSHSCSVAPLAAACAALLLQGGLRRTWCDPACECVGDFRVGAASPRGPLPGGEPGGVRGLAVRCGGLYGDRRRGLPADRRRRFAPHPTRGSVAGCGSRPRLPLRWGPRRSWCCVSTSPGCGACLPAADFSCVVLRNLLHYGCSAAARPYPTRPRRTAATREDRFWNRGQS